LPLPANIKPAEKFCQGQTLELILSMKKKKSYDIDNRLSPYIDWIKGDHPDPGPDPSKGSISIQLSFWAALFTVVASIFC
jgi:hypothetical protein